MRTKPKTWGTPCVKCNYRWCYHGRACIARQMRARKRAKQMTVIRPNFICIKCNHRHRSEGNYYGEIPKKCIHCKCNDFTLGELGTPPSGGSSIRYSGKFKKLSEIRQWYKDNPLTQEQIEFLMSQEYTINGAIDGEEKKEK